MGNAATNSPRGTVIDMESYRTSSPEAGEDRTLPRIANGPAGVAIEPCVTPVPNGQTLSEEEKLRIAKIRRDRRHGWMATFDDCDFMLAMLEKLTR